MRSDEARWAEWMQAANAGNSRAYRLLLEALTPFLRNLARRRFARAGLGGADVEDVVQETLLAFHLKRQTWDADQLFAPWVRAIARNKLIDNLRRRGNRRELPIEDFAEVLAAEPAAEEMSTVEFRRLLSILGGRQREIVQAICVGGASIKEASAKFGNFRRRNASCLASGSRRPGGGIRERREMRTEDLIKALAEDHAAHPRPGSLRRTFVGTMALGLGIAVIAFALTLGVRPDVASALGTWRFDFKLVMTITLTITSARFVWRLARPAVDARSAELALAAGPLLLLGAVFYELWVIPEVGWLQRAVGTNSVACVVSITLLSLAPLAAALYSLRRGEPVRPGLAGAAAGLLASALAATLYALHCPDDSPLFGAIWYMTAMGLVTCAGMLAGPRFLRW